MGYGREIHERANDVLGLRRQKAKAEMNARREKIIMELPAVKDMEAALTHIGVSTARAVFAGGDTKTELEKMRESSLKLQAELKALLATKGYTPEDLEEKNQCPQCKDYGYIDGKMCTCMKKLLRDISYDEINSRSPLPLDRSDFKSFDLSYYSTSRQNGVVPRERMESILKKCREYAENFSPNSPSILMEGGTGLGKTHLSLAIASRVIDLGYGVIYGSAPDIVVILEHEKFRNDSDSALKKRLETCDLLILDDLGTEFQSSFSHAAIYNLINTRMMRSKPTIINTNLSMAEMKKSYSDRLVSRLIGDNLYMKFFGEDIRMLKKDMV